MTYGEFFRTIERSKRLMHGKERTMKERGETRRDKTRCDTQRIIKVGMGLKLEL